MSLRAIMVSVDYTDLLAVTLPYNRHHFSTVTIVTSTRDYANVLPVAKANGADVFSTDSFYKDGATFNKFRALEEGLDWMGRSGWLCVMDADVLWPKNLQIIARGSDNLLMTVPSSLAAEGAVDYVSLDKGMLCTPLRRMCENLSDPIPLYNEQAWKAYPVHRNIAEWAGYTQIFHGSDPALGPAPWHETNWKHAGGADSFFQRKWVKENKVRPPWYVLHLGPAGENWCGRSSPYLGGATPDRGRENRKMLQAFVRGRTQGPNRFAGEKLP